MVTLTARGRRSDPLPGTAQPPTVRDDPAQHVTRPIGIRLPHAVNTSDLSPLELTLRAWAQGSRDTGVCRLGARDAHPAARRGCGNPQGPARHGARGPGRRAQAAYLLNLARALVFVGCLHIILLIQLSPDSTVFGSHGTSESVGHLLSLVRDIHCQRFGKTRQRVSCTHRLGKANAVAGMLRFPSSKAAPSASSTYARLSQDRVRFRYGDFRKEMSVCARALMRHVSSSTLSTHLTWILVTLIA